jgi:RNA polymerase sigma factor (sigma-70 family)
MQVSFLPAARSPESELLTQAQRYLTNRETGLPSDQRLEGAWIEFYRLYSDKIRKFTFTCGATEEDSADCIQEAWTELLVRLPAFRLDPGRGRFDSWVFQIVRSKAVDLCRSQKKCRALQEDCNSLQNFVTDHRNPTRTMEDKELFALAWGELGKRLSKCNFQILQMRLLEERSVAEVAGALGLSHEQVWYRFHRARRQAEAIGLAWTNRQR